jgi:hypothetical protein
MRRADWAQVKGPAFRAISYLVIPLGCAVEPEGSAVPLLMAVPLLPDVDVAWFGVGSVFTPGTPVAPPSEACAGVGLVFAPGTPVAPPWAVAPVLLCDCERARQRKSCRQCDGAKLHGRFPSWIERKIKRDAHLGSNTSSVVSVTLVLSAAECCGIGSANHTVRTRKREVMVMPRKRRTISRLFEESLDDQHSKASQY